MNHLRGLHMDRIFPRTFPMDTMIPTQPNTLDALESKTERLERTGSSFERTGSGFERTGSGYDRSGSCFKRTGSSFETTGSGFDRTGSGFTRNWSICLVLPVYGIIVCLVMWNMHLQAQLLLMRAHNNLNVRLSGH